MEIWLSIACAIATASTVLLVLTYRDLRRLKFKNLDLLHEVYMAKPRRREVIEATRLAEVDLERREKRMQAVQRECLMRLERIAVPPSFPSPVEAIWNSRNYLHTIGRKPSAVAVNDDTFEAMLVDTMGGPSGVYVDLPEQKIFGYPVIIDKTIPPGVIELRVVDRVTLR